MMPVIGQEIYFIISHDIVTHTFLEERGAIWEVIGKDGHHYNIPRKWCFVELKAAQRELLTRKESTLRGVVREIDALQQSIPRLKKEIAELIREIL